MPPTPHPAREIARTGARPIHFDFTSADPSSARQLRTSVLAILGAAAFADSYTNTPLHRQPAPAAFAVGVRQVKRFSSAIEERDVMFAALEFDHALFRPQIKWIVVECSGISRKCGGPIALAPRRDRAYFVCEDTAREDAEAYADFKNRQQQGCLTEDERVMLRHAQSGAHPARHYAYPWDHLLFVDSPLAWAVFEWSGDDAVDGLRHDAVYFAQADEAEVDAKVFAFLREKNRAKQVA